MPKMVHFGGFMKTWSLRSNSVTRQVIFNRTKKENAKIQKFKCDIFSKFQTLFTAYTHMKRLTRRLTSIAWLYLIRATNDVVSVVSHGHHIHYRRYAYIEENNLGLITSNGMSRNSNYQMQQHPKIRTASCTWKLPTSKIEGEKHWWTSKGLG